ncbi:MAG: glycosyltransferase family 2 protein [Candidatus Peribacteraceae bacterium]|nr:glycosyltransferase family 2 protein [Candidatus Peribacteraceae bacterium]MBP9850313.1 glycosyltransferase family 2 protein [Candidatus Peribacteraceae bacterium]
MRIAAVIPAYNEATRIAAVVREAAKYVEKVIVVVDGSTDDTENVARSTGAIVLVHSENCGAGAATMTGLDAARRLGYDVAVTLDADGQHSTADIPRLVETLKNNGADLVIANRFGRKNTIPFVRRVANTIGNLITFFVTGIYLPDTQCGFKAFGPKALAEIQLKMSGFEFCTEVIREAATHHWKIVSIPSKVVYSEYTLAKGQSFASGIRTAAKILLRTFLR